MTKNPKTNTRKNMKTYIKNTGYITILLLLIFSGCSNVTNNDDESTVTNEDLEIAAEVVGESLSDQNSGAMASLYDALSAIDQTGIRYQRQSFAKAKQDFGRGSETDYEYEYDPETGTHTIDFTRSVDRDDFSKSVTGHLEYIFADPEGTFVVFPKAHKDSIETIDYKAIREGESEGPRFESEFTRVDTLFLSGLHETSEIFEFEGTHFGEGTRIRKPLNRPEITTEYEVNFEFIDIEIDKEIVETNGTLEEGVTGTVNYSLVFTGTNGGQNRDKVVEGTVEFLGDGTGLLRFKNFAKVFRLSLHDGDAAEE